MEDFCKRHSEFKDQFGNLHPYLCNKKPFAEIEYKSGMTGELKTETVCKMHYNAMVKNCNRIQKVTGFDSQLKILNLI